mmetsp:Transcript_3561/g.4550  ORF Transcript_3561/g.4550 Transcript_3561/m.4550 type:complete len:386 (+) Transcript_3561:52-1209(+)
MALSLERFGSLRTSKVSLMALLLLAIVSTVYVRNDVFDVLDGGSDSRLLRMLKKGKKKKKGKKERCRPYARKNLMWLLSYPGAGEDEVMNLVEHATEQSMATNYGNVLTTGDFKKLKDDRKADKIDEACWREGPFKNNVDLPADSRNVLVKTHCGSYCMKKNGVRCGKKDRMRSFLQPRLFSKACAVGLKYSVRKGRSKRSKGYTKHSGIPKMVLLVRNPVAMVGARMAENKGIKVHELNRKQFLDYCKEIDDDRVTKRELDRILGKFLKDPEKADGVPCISEFFRIGVWYNRIIANVISFNGKGDVVFWEDLYSDVDNEGQDLLNYLGLERVSGKSWMMDEDAKMHNELLIGLLSKEEYDKVMTFVEAVSHSAWERLFVRYASD